MFHPLSEAAPSRRLQVARRGLAALALLLVASAPPARAQDAPTGAAILWQNYDLNPAACAFSPDGATLACGEYGKIGLLDAATGELLRTFGEKDFSVRRDGKSMPAAAADRLAWAPDGEHLAAAYYGTGQASIDGKVALYDVRTGEKVRMLAMGRPPNDLAFGPNGMRLAATGRGGATRVWTLGDEQAPPRELSFDHATEVAVLSPDARLLATGGRTLALWDLDSGERTATLALPEDAARVKALAWSADGRRLAASTDAFSVRVWDAESGDPLATVDLTPEGGLSEKERRVEPVPAFARSGRLATVMPLRETMQLWNVSDGEEALSFDVPRTGAMAWHDDRFVLMSTTSNVALRTLYADEKPERVDGDSPTQRLQALIPETLPGGLKRANVRIEAAEAGLMAEARFFESEAFNEAGTVELTEETVGVGLTMGMMSEERNAALREEIGSKAEKEQDGWEKGEAHAGGTVYRQTSEEDTVIIVFFDGSMVSLESHLLDVEQTQAALDALNIDEFKALAAER